LEQAQRKTWIETILAHMSGGAETDIEDAAKMLLNGLPTTLARNMMHHIHTNL
jgi:hypothetical protein